ncbi:MAG TPA: phosphoglucosamine mutase [Thermoanaerobaculia bacterium]
MSPTATTKPVLFGTDGIRAPFGEPPLDRPTVTAVAVALAESLREEAGGGEPRVVLAGDTRASTPEICRWVAAGLAAGGARPHYAGVLPTPAIAWLVRETGADAGVAVSASHNPLPDNGVKVIDRHGHKLSEAAEAALEARLDGGGADGVPRHPELVTDPAAAEAYLASLADRVRASVGAERPLDGLALAVDAAHGAAAPYAERLFADLGARVTALGDRPTGDNINVDCGSTHPEGLAAEVARRGLAMGVAFDGDADRAILIDEHGAERDGDAILYLWARHLLAAGRLAPAKIVATSMSNLGLERALAEIGVEVVRCGVGDRVVVETMQREGIVLGGEQSGHVVDLDLSTTGDGLLTGLTMAALVAASGETLSGLLAGFVRYPQVLLNVRVASKPELESLPRVAAAARRVEDELGADGRLVLRYSGTEPLARVMIEGPEQERIERLAGEIAAAIEEEIGKR